MTGEEMWVYLGIWPCTSSPVSLCHTRPGTPSGSPLLVWKWCLFLCSCSRHMAHLNKKVFSNSKVVQRNKTSTKETHEVDEYLALCVLNSENILT